MAMMTFKVKAVKTIQKNSGVKEESDESKCFFKKS
jgi:hypothetical protein